MKDKEIKTLEELRKIQDGNWYYLGLILGIILLLECVIVWRVW